MAFGAANLRKDTLPASVNEKVVSIAAGAGGLGGRLNGNMIGGCREFVGSNKRLSDGSAPQDLRCLSCRGISEGDIGDSVFLLSDVDPADGLDWEWFAVDKDGALAYFTSAGSSPVPVAALGISQPSRDRLTDHFEARPRITEAIINPARLVRRKKWLLSPDPMFHLRAGGWLDMTERGLYTYDSSNPLYNPSPYTRVATPAVPLRLSSVPPEVAALIVRVSLTSMSFCEWAVIGGRV